MEKKYKVYLDDVRTPIDNEWVVARNHDEFVETVQKLGLENIEEISLTMI
jgi:transcription antitermination factor NusA-like protein